MGFLGGASGKEHACQCRRCKRDLVCIVVVWVVLLEAKCEDFNSNIEGVEVVWASQVMLMVKNSLANAGDRCASNSWAGKIPCRRAWQPTPVFLPGESHGQRSLAGYSP